MPSGHSLQRSGAGRTAADFHWSGPLPASPGRLNDYQAPAARAGGAPFANRASGWHAGLPVPVGLLAPLHDEGHDEDAARPAEARTDPEALALGPAVPNPSRRSARFSLAAPMDTRLDAVVVDALGRTVLRLDARAGTLHLDASRLASGAYVLRVSAVSPDGRRDATSRPFTVVR